MMTATFFRRSQVHFLGKKLQSLVAFGLRDEYLPLWPVPLPPQPPHCAGKPTLVLDIDETLLHTYGMRLVREDTVGFSLYLRPHAREFLQELKELYEIVFWTAGTASYCSAMVDALEVQVLQLPRSFYNVEEIKHLVRGSPSTEHVNFFALSRTQTLEENSYMKYLPMLGRPMHRVIMVDDNVRSFPLNPRNAVKISPFLPDDRVLMEYSQALSLMKENGDEKKEWDASLLEVINRGKAEILRLEQDEALLQLLPLLRSVAKAEDLPRELDHWRDDDYVRCDDFHETMNSRSVARQRILGSVLPSRRDTPIPPLKTHVMNRCFLDEANIAMQTQHMRCIRSRL
ncbi:PTP1-interacting protein, 39 kDa, putative [Trypanosoma cruzi]|uniref:Mitochondrial import inner membrane translocase subunit TIM50 n=2 Tax=Trypanosoma cruzi TaxID=5693 RepID=V5B4L5_TRYCR|nr:PTP1-interacting protein, 39 kDa, putative [Trypanosoma cruzi]ESS68130.1 PTP1-interacting protein [Trypanosoma cruzi Dm28c]PBJ80017.1 PTP1-interacting protein, 39 kDa [Trypanosoma cruzi cruzi]KAF8278007.1 putative PTP1-interacting protein, 39 kDa [Trypanosoma cruzi]PWU94449.1 putative PTP1-interacting protein, 39 kDa [Trypanosoma cruzi]